MDKGNNLIYGLLGISLGIFGLCYTYKYFKMGKMWVPRNPKPYSFKREPKKAYKIMLANCIVSILAIIGGIILVLSYFHILE